MTIWAFKGPSLIDYTLEELQQVSDFLMSSLRRGVSRFGWGYMEEANLNTLKPKSIAERTEEESKCWKKAHFLLLIKKGDWIIYINLPNKGDCIAARVTESYSFEKEDNEVSDYRHIIKIDPATIVEFERDDEKVSPILITNLKQQGRFWRINHTDEFLKTLARFNKIAEIQSI